MKVCLISDVAKSGGAAVAANRIACGLSEKSKSISRISSDGCLNSAVNEYVLFYGMKHLILEKFLALLGSQKLISVLKVRQLCHQLEVLLLKIQPDIINIHNLHSSAWPIELVNLAKKYAPVAWTLHDCWSFYGRSYPSHSELPTIETTKSIRRFWHKVDNDRKKGRLTAVTPSDWINKEASNSYWRNHKVKTIHNPIPSSFFKEIDRQSAQKVFGFAGQKPVVLFISGDLNEKRKGGNILREVLDELKNDNVEFLLIGKGYENEELPKNSKLLGFVSDEITLRLAYAAADILLHLAPVDNLPNTVAESMCGGTPTLCFDIGGLSELVLPGKSGWLVKEHSSFMIVKELRKILKSSSYLDYRETTRKKAAELFSEENTTNQYFENFKDCIQKKWID